MIPESLSRMANHLWQSTLFACAAWLLTLALRKNSARVRHWVWVTASLKFMVPFSMLIALGSQVPWRAAQAAPQASVSIALDQVSQPFAAPASSASMVVTTAPRVSVVPAIVWTLWVCGLLGVGATWLLRWRRVAAAVRAGSPVDLDIPIGAVRSPAFIEPGIFGIFRPVLLLPEGIFEHLTQEQWKAVVAHELCHVRRRDNLVGLMQMFVETMFWFHPLTWRIGKRIFEERERACDEEVVKQGNEPRVYARSILKICELYLESPMPCVAGVSGSNLRMRVESILNGRIAKTLNDSTKALLGAAGLFAVAAPIAIGLLHGVTLRAQTVPQFDVIAIRPSPTADKGVIAAEPESWGEVTGKVSLRYVTLKYLITQSFNLEPGQLTGPAWLDDAKRIDILGQVPPGTSKETVRQMFQALLAERFGMRFHRETKTVSGYAMKIGGGGHKMEEVSAHDLAALDSEPVPSAGKRTGQGDNLVLTSTTVGKNGRITIRADNEGVTPTFYALTMQRFAESLSQPCQLGRPVVDMTGITGAYRFSIYTKNADRACGGVAPDPSNNNQAAVASEPRGGSLMESLQKLGLVFVSQKVTSEKFVIDHIEENASPN